MDDEIVKGVFGRLKNAGRGLPKEVPARGWADDEFTHAGSVF
jgi:hypothetical protein